MVDNIQIEKVTLTDLEQLQVIGKKTFFETIIGKSKGQIIKNITTTHSKEKIIA